MGQVDKLPHSERALTQKSGARESNRTADSSLLFETNEHSPADKHSHLSHSIAKLKSVADMNCLELKQLYNTGQIERPLSLKAETTMVV